MGGDSSKDKEKETEPKTSSASTTEDAQKPQDPKPEDSMDVDVTNTAAVTANNDSSTSPTSPTTTPAPTQTHPLTSLTTTALATSAARSSLLATHEERSATRLIATATNLTLRKYELKLAQFAELEDIIQAERRDLDKGRQQLFLDQLRFRKRVRDVEAQLKALAMGGGAAGGEGALKGLQDVVREGVLGAGFGFAAAAAAVRDDGEMTGTEV